MDYKYSNKKPRPKTVNIDGFIQPRIRSFNKPTPKKVINLAPKPQPRNVKKPIYDYPKEKIKRTTSPTTQEYMTRPRKPFNKTRNDKPIVDKNLITRRIVACLLGLILIVGFSGVGFLGFRLLKTSEKVFGGSFASNIGDLLGNGSPLNGEDSGRVNILLAGDSADDPGHSGANLTDSILILSIDTKTNNTFLLSIPRDLWVKMPIGTWPGNSYQKINAANEIADFNQPGYPKGGMGALSWVVQNEIGIPINYYGLINYSAFKDAVDAVGGVTITINSPDPRGIYDSNTKIKLPNGPATLNGLEALNLARSRGDGVYTYGFPNSDFNRTQYQRQLLLAVATKAKSAGVVGNPSKVSNLFNVLGKNLSTDLSLSNVLRAISLTKNIDTNNVASNSFCSTLTVGIKGCTVPILKSYSDPNSGQSALSPVAGINDFGQLAQYYKKLASNNPIVKEGASVVILNGTDTSGLALKVKNKLENKGMYVAGTYDASKNYPSSTIIDNSKGKDPMTLLNLRSIFGNNVSTKQLEGSYPEDFVVIVGSNYKN